MKHDLSISRQINSFQQIEGMQTGELIRQQAAHEAECVVLAGKIDIDPRGQWARGAKQALRTMRMHRDWINRELMRREKESAINRQQQQEQDRAAAKLAAAEHHRAVNESRIRRIEASTNESVQAFQVFKAVCREALGRDEYDRLWELTNKRMKT